MDRDRQTIIIVLVVIRGGPSNKRPARLNIAAEGEMAAQKNLARVDLCLIPAQTIIMFLIIILIKLRPQDKTFQQQQQNGGVPNSGNALQSGWPFSPRPDLCLIAQPVKRVNRL